MPNLSLVRFLRNAALAFCRPYVHRCALRRQWRLGFRQAGHGVVAQVEDADVAVFNSCAVTLDAARSSRKSTRRLHRLNPDAKIVLTGCYASLDPDEAAGIAGVDLVVPNAEKHELVSQVLKSLPHWEMPASAQEAPDVDESADRSRAFVKVQDGCRHKCTYCIVKLGHIKNDFDESF